jgi:cyclopropane-fatty-acyl-phospholipid synthase
MPRKMEETNLARVNRGGAGFQLILQSLRNVKWGHIQMTLPWGEIIEFSGRDIGLSTNIYIKDLKVFDLIMDKSDIGFGEAYVQGLWETDDIAKVIEFAVLNRDALAEAMAGQWRKILLYKMKHFFNSNSKVGSQKNISAHYDLGNSFYRLWLDETMTYSSAYWGKDEWLTLPEAQLNKYQLLLEQLNAQPGEHILEIGCGWGGFAEFAAHRGLKVTGITISKEQFDFATERIRKQGLQDQVDIQFLDYRDVQGQFDHVISIEMIEAVGAEFWPQYFNKIREVLKKNGTAAIQSITIQDSLFDQYRKGTDFIQQYVFPGGLLPCEQALKKTVGAIFGLEPQFLRFGIDYAKTLRHWHDKFIDQQGAVSKMGYSVEFQRLWRFYLGYCEGAFRGGQINVVAMKFQKI